MTRIALVVSDVDGTLLTKDKTLTDGAKAAVRRLHQVGMHHFAFLVDDLRSRVEKLSRAGVKILVPPYEADSIAYGERGGGKVLTSLFEDPDGTILQFDQRMH